MADDAIAVVVAGSGAVTEKEAFDLLDDWATGIEKDVEINLVVPNTKSLATDAVFNAVNWFLADDSASEKDIITVQVEGEGLSRKTSAWGDGSEKVKSFEDIFEDEWDGFASVEFFIAMPEPGAEDYDQHVAWVEAATDNKIKIRDLCAGLDDVVLTEPEEPEPAPEPEPEPEAKPTRRRRSTAKKDPEPEPVAEEKEEKPDLVEKIEEAQEKPKTRSRTKKEDGPVNPTPNVPQEALGMLNEVLEYLVSTDRSAAMFHREEHKDRPITALLREAYTLLTARSEDSAPAAPEEPASEPEEAPKRGRGRPRENFEVKEIFDEDKGEWIPRPRGRVAKGTEWRVRDSRDDSITDEGTVA